MSLPIAAVRRLTCCALVATIGFAAHIASAQLIFTEVMHNPGGDDALWEWVEVRNTSGSAVSLDGWVFDDEVLYDDCVAGRWPACPVIIPL